MMEDLDSEDSIVEEREKLMISPTGGNPFLKKAHFLKPTLRSSINEPPPFKLPRCFSFLQSQLERSKCPLKVRMRGWPDQKILIIKTWADQMASAHQSTWKKAGIFEAIFNSTYQIRRQKDLIIGLTEKWCSETNSFIFPWGEATVTLEDVMVLGGFSVLGDSVLSPFETRELKEIEEKLEIERRKLYQKSFHGTRAWVNKFMNSGDELEHEAFLAFWLSRYVFRDTHSAVNKFTISLAVHLARGTRLIALAPPVLASIYRDLGLLRRAIVASNDLKTGDTPLELKSPFHLVQVWAWERFSELRPEGPNVLSYGEPRVARWDKVEGEEIENIRLALDSAGENFLWRPYALDVIKNWHFPKYYPEKEMWVLVGPDLDDELLSFIRCLKVSELVGLGTIEHYLPHRVAMQFGYDQDLPCTVTHSHQSSDMAWKHYSKKFKNVRLYLPSRLFEADVSIKYLKWRKQALPDLEDAIEAAVPRRKRTKKLNLLEMRTHRPFVFPCFGPKDEKMETEYPMDEEDKLTISEFLKYRKKKESFGARQDGGEGDKLFQNAAFPIADESCVVGMKSMESIIDEEGVGSSSSFSEKGLLESEKRDLKLEIRFKRLESVLAKLKAHASVTN